MMRKRRRDPGVEKRRRVMKMMKDWNTLFYRRTLATWLPR